MPIQPTTDAGGKRRGASVVGSLRQRRQLLRAKGRAYARVITAFYGALLVGLMTAFPTGPAQAEPPRSVLILDQSEPNSPWGNEFRATLRSSLNEGAAAPIAVYVEMLDLGRFNGSGYENLLRTFLREKYRDKPIGVIVVVGSDAVEFLTRLRNELWSAVPIVFVAMGQGAALRSILPPDATGTFVRLPLGNAIAAARSLVPGLKRIALVGDPIERQPFFHHFTQELQDFTAELEFIDLLGLPMEELKRRVATLPEDSAIVYLPIYIDGAGTTYIPREALRPVSEAANRPVVVNVEPQIGSGATGGIVAFAPPVAHDAARRAVRILNGEAASQIPITVADFARPVFDWRQLQRFGISEAALPSGSEIRFRPPGLWQYYRTQVIGAFAVVLMQAVLIAGLLLERRRRVRAEAESHQRLVELAHVNRTAAVSAMSSSIAHELNQPLCAILNNAEAAELLVAGNPIDVPLLKDILADIRKADQHAAAIITGLRGLLQRKQNEQHAELSGVMRDAVHLLDAEAKTRRIEMSVDCPQSALFVRADPIHVEQILLNLGLNAMQAIDGSAERTITFKAAPAGDSSVEVSVSDTGTGIPENELASVFDPFFTTKPQGTGLGLSIVRTIVETYGGSISADNKAGGGAIFRFTLPLNPSPAG